MRLRLRHFTLYRGLDDTHGLPLHSGSNGYGHLAGTRQVVLDRHLPNRGGTCDHQQAGNGSQLRLIDEERDARPRAAQVIRFRRRMQRRGARSHERGSQLGGIG